MVFSSVTFLFYFLPIVLLVYFAVKPALRNFVFMIAGLIFYLWGAGGVVLILISSIILNWLLGLLAGKAIHSSKRWVSNLPMVGTVIINLGILGYYKYTNFMINQINFVTEKLIPGFEPIFISQIILPIGVSFFTFQAMSYVFDVARGRVAPLRNPVDFSMYICMFPQLIAGPIVRYHEIAGQIHKRTVTLDRFGQGAVRFCLGLFKKVVLADSIAVLADHVFSIGGGLSTGLAWLGLLAFTIQVYFDFSGYSDMAIGLGHLFGFKLPENFNRPYLAISVTDFWRRWHITLSRWFRDYVYIPMGGSRVPGWRVSLNLFTVFILVGFWHGANWTFIAFGLYHGLWMSAERFFGYGRTEKPQNLWLRRRATFFVVMLGMVLFRAENLTQAVHYYQTLFAWQAGTASLTPDYEMLQGVIWLLIGLVIVFLSGNRPLGVLMEKTEGRRVNLLKIGIVTMGMLLASMMIVSRDFKPFIYFRF